MTDTRFCNYCKTEHQLTKEFWYRHRGKLGICKIYAKNYFQKPEVREKTNDYYRKYRYARYRSDPQYKMQLCLRQRLRQILKEKQIVKTCSVFKHLGCTLEQLKKYIEKQFQPGMTWENHSINGWHIDHIKPLSLFDLTDPEQQKQACHYTNLQPLWAKDNLRKNNSYNI